MKKLEYILNIIHYGFYLFFRKNEGLLDPNYDGKYSHFLSKGVGICFEGGIVMMFLSVYFFINKILGFPPPSENKLLWVGLFIIIIVLITTYYLVYKKDKYMIYIKDFEKEKKTWKYVIISFLFLIVCVLLFMFSVKINFEY